MTSMNKGYQGLPNMNDPMHPWHLKVFQVKQDYSILIQAAMEEYLQGVRECKCVPNPIDWVLVKRVEKRLYHESLFPIPDGCLMRVYRPPSG